LRLKAVHEDHEGKAVLILLAMIVSYLVSLCNCDRLHAFAKLDAVTSRFRDHVLGFVHVVNDAQARMGGKELPTHSVRTNNGIPQKL
jgi:hypothetical protein